MASIFESEYVSISFHVARKIGGKLPFDVFIRLSEQKFTKLFPKGEGIDEERLKTYESDKGVDLLYIKNDDYRAYLLFVENLADKMFENPKSIDPELLAHVVKELTHLTMLEIVTQQEVDADTATHAATTVEACIDLLAKEPKHLVKIFVMISSHPYVLKHSLSTAIFSLLLAKEAKLESKKTLLSIGMGALLHDTGMSRLSFNPDVKEELTPEEWKEVKEHPQIGKQLLDPVKAVSTEVRNIVLQHHEQPNGMGYPNGLRDREIYFPAKIIAIADSFSALMSKRPFREEAYSPVKAIEFMVEDRGKFDSELLKLFAKLFIKTKA